MLNKVQELRIKKEGERKKEIEGIW